MARITALCALPWLAAGAFGQNALYGVRGNGDVLRINTASGAGVFVGSSGVVCQAAYRWAPFVTQGPRPEFLGILGPANQVARVTPWSGQVLETGTISGVPTGYSIRAFGGGDMLLAPDDPTAVGLLAHWEASIIVIGPTGRTDLQSLAYGPNGLVALGTDGGGGLYQLDTVMGAATLIGGGGFGDARALATLDNGSLVAAGSNLLAVNATTGATTLIGPIGISDVRGLTVVSACIADCAAGGPPPWLSVQDFICFQSKFAAGDPYANCDGSTTPPVLNVADFICFMSAFAAQCQ